MNAKVNTTLKGVPETMLLTLYARANYSKKRQKLFYDKKSLEIARRLNYDFSAAHSDEALNSLTISRTVLIDNLVKDFIKQNPYATVINIACGLDTRFFRVDNGLINWYDIDLKETIDIRKHFFENSGRQKMIAASAMDESWTYYIDNPKGKVLVLIEGLSMYLNDLSIRKIFSIIHQNFPDAEVFMEIMPKKHVEQNFYKSVKAANASFSWGINSGNDIDLNGFTWDADYSVNLVMKKMGVKYRFLSYIPYYNKNSEKIAVFKTKKSQSFNYQEPLVASV